MSNNIIIRMASVEDAGDILNIYRYYVEHTAITMEYEVPSLGEFETRIQNTLKTYPYLVAVVDGKIAGYAYASAFHPRAGFSKCVEVSIYVDRMARKCGLGRKLYEKLESSVKDLGFLNLYASISYTEKEDEYLNNNSTEFHAHMGYEQVARFHKCAYKFENWYDLVWMEKFIGEHE